MLIDEIRQHADTISYTVIGNRKHLHAHPELSFHEYKTSAFIKSRLDEMGIEWKAMAGTGVVASIKGEQPSARVIALRADMDALPIAETNEVDYK